MTMNRFAVGSLHKRVREPCRGLAHALAWTLAACLFAADVAAAAGRDLPVFPGAEGWGTRTRAGRGGRVIAVTSLADSGPGTLRAALDERGPRIVVFRVGGMIVLEDKLYIKNPYVTIAGQTAPGDGIALRDFGLVIATHDVLLQYIRIRPGNQGDIAADANDAIEILGDSGNRGVPGASNVVIDHVSASWAEDEVMSTWFGAHDITISWSIISEGLNRSRHHKGTHSSGLVVGNKSNRVSVHHNLLAHNHSRNPLFKSGGTHEFVGNVVYDWAKLGTDVVDDAPVTRINLMRNLFLPGPATDLVQEMLIERHGSSYVPKLYVRDNVGPNIKDPAGDPWAGVFTGFSMTPAPANYRAPRMFDTPVAAAADGASDHERVLREAGASLPRRDAVDDRIVADVRRRTGGIIDSPDQVGGFPPYRNGKPKADSDGDGMPDSWERGLGLDPRNPGDGSGDRDGDGYTNVEEYLFSLRR